MNLDKRLLNLLKNVRILMALAVIFGVAAGVFTIGQAAALSRTISRAFLQKMPLRDLASFIYLFGLFSLLRAAAIWLQEMTAGKVARHVKDSVRSALIRKLLQLGPVRMKSERSGEISNTLLSGVDALDAYFSQYLPQLFLSTLIPVTILFFVFPNDLLTGFVFLLTAPLIPLFMILIGNIAQALTQKQWKTLSRLSAHFLDVLQGLTTLKILGRSQEQIKMIADISNDFRVHTMTVLRVAFLSALVLELVSTISTAVVAVEIGLRLLYAKMAFENALFILILAPEFYLPMRLLGTRFHAGMEGTAAARRIFQILETSAPEPLSTPARVPDLKQAVLKFESVSFSYDSGSRPALQEVSFTLEPGKRTALVGPSGSGKTTITHLLLRFLKPESGRLLANDQPISHFNPDDWRRQIAWVPQNPHLFYGTLAENIRMGQPEASLTQIEQAAKQAEMDDFIRALPRGYDTLIGEKGARLSGGQAQRLALARAFLKNAPFVILDEPTSNLDPEVEAKIQSAMQTLMQGRRVLLIAHRLSTSRSADRILVIFKGRILEAGTHESLLQQNGLYKKLVTAYEGVA
ncbi:MAG: thiol reductant ABC exporter subunit CydD [Calditrichaeota bacterium]|nr:thiol reductant ABC exporter subunit CydD [Calditrichota bacterium]